VKMKNNRPEVSRVDDLKNEGRTKCEDG
jgi:hypothetical protein